MGLHKTPAGAAFSMDIFMKESGLGKSFQHRGYSTYNFSFTDEELDLSQLSFTKRVLLHKRMKKLRRVREQRSQSLLGAHPGAPSRGDLARAQAAACMAQGCWTPGCVSCNKSGDLAQPGTPKRSSSLGSLGSIAFGAMDSDPEMKPDEISRMLQLFSSEGDF